MRCKNDYRLKKEEALKSFLFYIALVLIVKKEQKHSN